MTRDIGSGGGQRLSARMAMAYASLTRDSKVPCQPTVRSDDAMHSLEKKEDELRVSPTRSSKEDESERDLKLNMAPNTF